MTQFPKKFVLFFYLIILPVFFCLISPALAQSAVDKLDLAQAVALCKTNNLSLQQQVKRVEQARAQVAVQLADYFPSIRLNGKYAHVSELARFDLPITLPGLTPQSIVAGVKNQYDLNATVVQPVFVGFRTRNLVKSAKAEVELKSVQQQVVRNGLLLQVHQFYYASLLNRLQQKVLDVSEKRLKQHLQSVRNFYQEDQATAFDTLKVANILLEVQTRLANLDHAYRNLLGKLAEVLNVDEIREISIPDFGQLDFQLPREEDLLQSARNQRPELRQLIVQKRAVHFKRLAAKSARFPQVFAQASYHYARPGVNFFKDEWMKYYTVGVQFQWELWHRNKTGNTLRQLTFNQQSLAIGQEKLIHSIEREVREAYRNLLSERKQITMAGKLVQQEKEKYRITKNKNEQGVANVVELTDAESDLTAAELQLEQLYVNWLMDQAKLRFAIGKIDEVSF